MDVYIFFSFLFFFFNDTATTELSTLSLHDALPISRISSMALLLSCGRHVFGSTHRRGGDRKSTRLNSSHSQISYAVFCLKKKTHQKKNAQFERSEHDEQNERQHYLREYDAEHCFHW